MDIQPLTSNDHDLLIELRTEMRGMRTDLKTLSDGVSKQVTDHENRLRSIEESAKTLPITVTDHEARLRVVEKSTENLMAKMVFGISVISFIMTIIAGVVINWIKSLTGI